VKDKAIPVETWTAPEGSRRLRAPDFKTTAHEGGELANPRHRPPLPAGNIPDTHFCQRLSRPLGNIAAGRIVSMKP